MYRRILEAKRRVLPPDHPSTIITLVNLGSLLVEMDRAEEAETVILEAVERARRAGSGALMQQVGALNVLGRMHQRAGRMDQAIGAWDEAARTLRDSAGPEHPALLTLLTNLARAHSAAGDHAAAERSAREGLSLAERTVGPHHGSTVPLRLALAAALEGLGRTDDALAVLEALAADEAALGAARGNPGDEARAAIARLRGTP